MHNMIHEHKQLEVHVLKEQERNSGLYVDCAKWKEEAEKWKALVCTSAKELKSAQTRIKEAKAQSLLEGINTCLNSWFDAPPGQQFFRTLHESWLEAYHKSTSFLGNMGKFVPYFLNHGFDHVIAQHKEPSFDGTYNRVLEMLLEGLDTPT